MTFNLLFNKIFNLTRKRAAIFLSFMFNPFVQHIFKFNRALNFHNKKTSKNYKIIYHCKSGSNEL